VVILPLFKGRKSQKGWSQLQSQLQGTSLQVRLKTKSQETVLKNKTVICHYLDRESYYRFKK